MRLFALAAGLVVALAFTLAAIAATPEGGWAPAPQRFVVEIAGAGHGTATSANIAVQPRVPVEVTLINRTTEVHTFTVPELGLNVVLLPARNGVATTRTIRFTPKHGVVRWHCVPCVDHMGGMMLALLEPRFLSR